MKPVEQKSAFCPICGENSLFTSHLPIDFPCKRNSFLCDKCESCARNRHLSLAILDNFPVEHSRVQSLAKWAQLWQGAVFLTCTSGAIHDALRHAPGCVSSEYIDGIPSGGMKDGVLCQDIQRTSFDDETFDLIVTEDVLEHVPNPKQAFAEIRRILKPGGFHIATIPVNWGRSASAIRAIMVDGTPHHILEPEYHGDPTRPEGILAFTDYGTDLIDEYLSITGPSKMLAAHGDVEMEDRYAIYNSWVFVSQRPKQKPAGLGWVSRVQSIISNNIYKRS